MYRGVPGESNNVQHNRDNSTDQLKAKPAIRSDRVRFYALVWSAACRHCEEASTTTSVRCNFENRVSDIGLKVAIALEIRLYEFLKRRDERLPRALGAEPLR